MHMSGKKATKTTRAVHGYLKYNEQVEFSRLHMLICIIWKHYWIFPPPSYISKEPLLCERGVLFQKIYESAASKVCPKIN